MGLGWCVSLSFLAAACTAGCGRFSFQSSDANDALADDASGLDDYFALAPPPFSTTDDVFTPVPGSQIGLDVRPADRPWIIWMSATLGSTLGDEMSVELRYTINGVERGYAGVQNLVPERRGSFHHFVAVDTSADTATLEVQLRDASGGTATVEQLRIVGFVAPPGADIHYSEVNTPVAVTTTSPAEYHRLTLTPSAPGTYVVFGAVAGSEVPSTAADVEVRWVDDIDGTVFPAPRYMNVRQPWQTFTMVRLLDVPDTAPRAVWLEAAARTPGGVRASHLLAMRADAFGDVIGRLDEPLITVTSPDTAVTSEVIVPAVSGAAYVVVQSVRLHNPCPGASTREASFVVDDATVTSIGHTIDNCAYQPGYGSVSLVERDGPLGVRNVVAPTMGQLVEAAVSYIYVLRLP